MPDLNQLTMFKQKDVEKLFAATVFASPIEAIQQCGWLRSDMLLNQQVSRFWKSTRERITPDMSGTDRANEEILKIAMENDLFMELTAWVQDVTYSHLPLPYAQEIARRSYMTGLSSKLGDLVRAIQTGDDQEARRVIGQMDKLDTSGSMKMNYAYDIAVEFERIIGQGVRSVETFVPGIDNATGGLERQTMTVIAGRTSTGKTALSWQIAQQVAYSGKKVIFFSLEMSRKNVWGRAACPKIGVTWRDVRAGKLTKDQQDRLRDAQFALAAQFEDKLIIQDEKHTTDTIWQVVAQERPDLIVVDHLRLVKDVNKISEVRRLGEISQNLKEIAKNFNCASLVLSQLNRDIEKRGEGNDRPMLADLRDSGEIEENADIVLMLYRQKRNGVFEWKNKNRVELWIRKFRDGPSDVLINLDFDPPNQWFESVEK